MNTQIKQVALEFKIGLFILGAVAVLLFFLLSHGKIAQMQGYEIKVSFGYVGGLEVGSPIRLSGVRVGEVKRIQILYDSANVLVTCQLYPDVKVAANSQFTIRTLGLIGEKCIEIYPGDVRTGNVLSPNDVVTGTDPISLEKMVGMGEDIIRNLNEVLVGAKKIVGDEQVQKDIKELFTGSRAAIANASSVMDRIDTLAQSLGETNKELKDFFVLAKPKFEHSVDNFNNTLTTATRTLISANNFFISGQSLVLSTDQKLDSFFDNANTFVASLDNKVNEFGVLKSDLQTSLEHIDGFFKDSRQFIVALQTKGLFADLMNDEDLGKDIKKEIVLLQEATEEFRKTAAEFASFSTKINKLATELEDAQGSAGKFLYSDELYDEVLDFVKDIKAHPWKLLLIKKK